MQSRKPIFFWRRKGRNERMLKEDRNERSKVVGTFVCETKLLEKDTEYASVCEAKLLEKNIEFAYVCEVEHEEDNKSHYAKALVDDEDDQEHANETANVVVETRATEVVEDDDDDEYDVDPTIKEGDALVSQT